MDEKISNIYYCYKEIKASPPSKSSQPLQRFQKMTQKNVDTLSPLANLSFCPKTHSSPQIRCVHPKRSLLFLSRDTVGRGRGGRTYKFALTVDVASRFKEAEPLTSKDSAEVVSAFLKIYKRGL